MVLASLPGTLPGTIDVIAVPVKKESDPSKPLSRVECDWDDPYNDTFIEEKAWAISF